MSKTLVQKPVIVRYPVDVEPTPEHPAGFLAGQAFEAATPAVAAKFHPQADVLRYADGSAYPQHESPHVAPTAPKTIPAPKGSRQTDSAAQRRGRR